MICVPYPQLIKNTMAYLCLYMQRERGGGREGQTGGGERKEESTRNIQKKMQKIKRWIWVESIWVLYYSYACNLSVWSYLQIKSQEEEKEGGEEGVGRGERRRETECLRNSGLEWMITERSDKWSDQSSVSFA